MKKKSLLNSADVDLLIGAMKVVFPMREDVDKIVEKKLDEKIKLLPTKDEFFARMDKLSGEYKKIDEAETLLDGQLSDHNDALEKHEARIKALESRHGSKPIPPIAS
jgi:hypothetical protein